MTSLDVLRPVRSGNMLEETFESLLHAIRLGVFPPGERLPAERVLAERLGISRSTLREVLAELQEAHIVTVQRGRYGGTFVCSDLMLPPETTSFTAEQLNDALTFRKAVEPAAAELAAQATLTSEQRERLTQSLTQLKTVNLTEYRPLDSRLHLLIAEFAGSPSLLAAVAQVRLQTNGFLSQIPLLKTNLAHSSAQHHQIVSSILNGNPEQARDAMTEHLAGTEALLRGFLN